MSKYAGSITIVDDQGNVAFERELGTDEIIDALIERISFFQKPPESGEGVVVGPHNISAVIKKTQEAFGGKAPKRQYKKRESKAVDVARPKAGRFETKECCGSTGTRHFKWCKEVGGTGDPTLVAVAGGRIPFSEKTYNAVRSMFKEGLTADAISREKGFDIGECVKIRESSTYDAYRRAK